MLKAIKESRKITKFYRLNNYDYQPYLWFLCRRVLDLILPSKLQLLFYLFFPSSYHSWAYNRKSKVYFDKVQHIYNLPSLPSPCWHVAGCIETKMNLFNCSGGLSKVCKVASAVWLLKEGGRWNVQVIPQSKVKLQTQTHVPWVYNQVMDRHATQLPDPNKSRNTVTRNWVFHYYAQMIWRIVEKAKINSRPIQLNITGSSHSIESNCHAFKSK